MQQCSCSDYGMTNNVRLYNKYSAAQEYYYVKDINQIIYKDTTAAAINYKYLVGSCCNQSTIEHYNLKPFDEVMRKVLISSSKRQDRPRLFLKQIKSYYQRWLNKKRKLNNKSITKFSSRLTQTAPQNASKILEQISQYNPKSKKYYLIKLSKFMRLKTLENIEQSTSILELNKQLKHQLNRHEYVKDISNISITRIIKPGNQVEQLQSQAFKKQRHSAYLKQKQMANMQNFKIRKSLDSSPFVITKKSASETKINNLVVASQFRNDTLVRQRLRSGIQLKVRKVKIPEYDRIQTRPSLKQQPFQSKQSNERIQLKIVKTLQLMKIYKTYKPDKQLYRPNLIRKHTNLFSQPLSKPQTQRAFFSKRTK